MWTLAELCRLGVSSIGPELVSAAARNRLMSLPASGPRAADFAAFECRLDGRDERVDVAFALQGRSARAAVRHWLRTSRDQDDKDPAFRTCYALLRAWAADTGPLSELGSIWIEVDLEPERPASAFLYFRPEQTGQFWQRQHAPLVRPLLEAWARASQATLEPAASERLAHCISSLPEGARVLLIAPQLHQMQTAIRMSFRVSADRLLPYLERIGWRGASDVLLHQLRVSGAQRWALPIQIDMLSDQLSPTISIELTQSSENGYAEPSEGVLASWLHERTCAVSAAAALLRWRYAPSTDSDAALGVTKLLDLKLTIAGDGSLRSKAYLGTLGINRYFQSPATRSRALARAPNAPGE